jgi:hypothetical protein
MEQQNLQAEKDQRTQLTDSPNLLKKGMLWDKLDNSEKAPLLCFGKFQISSFYYF